MKKKTCGTCALLEPANGKASFDETDEQGWCRCPLPQWVEDIVYRSHLEGQGAYNALRWRDQDAEGCDMYEDR